MKTTHDLIFIISCIQNHHMLRNKNNHVSLSVTTIAVYGEQCDKRDNLLQRFGAHFFNDLILSKGCLSSNIHPFKCKGF